MCQFVSFITEFHGRNFSIYNNGQSSDILRLILVFLTSPAYNLVTQSFYTLSALSVEELLSF